MDAQEDIEAQRGLWGLPNTYAGTLMAAEYMNTLRVNSFYAISILLPYTIDGIRGVLMAVSTPTSTRVCRQNHQVLEDKGIPDRISFACVSFEAFTSLVIV